MKLGIHELDEDIYVIAEAGVNHNGDMAMARRLIDTAVNAGANAVKFQTFSADRLAAADAPLADYQKSGGAKANSQHEMLKKLELSRDDHHELKSYAEGAGIDFLSTPFDEESADLLASLGVCAIKISSTDLTNHMLLEHVAGFGIPLILSTGASSLGDIEQAVSLLRDHQVSDLCLLHCVSAYPAGEAEANLRTIPVLGDCFGVPIGWSDHTTGQVTALVAVALGAQVIEKHITLDHSLPGPDHRASMEPAAFDEFVANIRLARKSLGDGVKRRMQSEEDVARVARRSLAAARDIQKGEQISRDMICALRPGTGMPPSAAPCLIGRTASCDINRHQLIDPGMVQ